MLAPTSGHPSYFVPPANADDKAPQNDENAPTGVGASRPVGRLLAGWVAQHPAESDPGDRPRCPVGDDVQREGQGWA